ncbi:MAG TPA: cobyrinate a,c-diamide synthase [Spirochaetota bacterium]|nr:cobyrinate a,c-diamide synthase [Spirochaetota bacterium]HQJ72909.1 cobyrinate a,c-diamide synthase [Spirochaetota bacterium]HRS76191.1 cobyrinate a,c-diamide synthase [Spirochaetota bacterium]HRT73855.1 cobyrinate a,c-diamide synthase [Spirochaetota bacterium]
MTGSKPTLSRQGIAIAGLRGGSGKTLTALGLIAALERRGLSVAPFKKGPDYIDPAWLSHAAGRDCHNLDTYLLDPDTITQTYLTRNSYCQVALVEGNRGIFDGVDIEGTHSIAELAKLLGLPVILVVDCAKASRTVAALVRGCQAFDPCLALRGVILNRVAGERHRSIAAGAIERYCGVPVLGAIPRIAGLDLAERHLGLLPVSEHSAPSQVVGLIADAVESSVDIGRVLGIMEQHAYPSFAIDVKEQSRAASASAEAAGPAIGVIRDSAFSFYYPETIEALRRHGARIIEIDSLRDGRLPAVEGLYIGGGFPETHVEKLSANRTLMKSVRDAVETGLPVYAECGGLVYLSESLEVNGTNYPMAGVFPLRFGVTERPQGHGYTSFTADRANPYYPAGTSVRGHEFRYSRLTGTTAPVETVFAMGRGTGLMEGRDGIIRNNALGTFCHTHALGRGVSWPEALVSIARKRMP